MKLRIAMATPLPPDPSGIADYSAELLKELALLADVDVFYVGQTPDASNTSGIRVFPFQTLYTKHDDYNEIILQISSEPNSKQIVDFAGTHPSTIVMHDLNISGIFGHAYLSTRSFGRFFLEILHQEGWYPFLKASSKFVLTRQCPGPNDYYMNKIIVRSAKKIIVHSKATADLLMRRHGHPPVSVIPHGTLPINQIYDINALRKELGLPSDAFIVGAFGIVDKRKRIHVLLQSLAQLKSKSAIYCCLVGLAPNEWNSIIKELDIESRVHLTGRVSIEDFYKYIAAVDLCVNLRYPWIGEESGPLLRIMACGKPVVVSNIGSFAEIPDEACFKVSTGESEMNDLTCVIEKAMDSNKTLEDMGSIARDYCLQQHTWKLTASGYMKSIKRVSIENRDIS